MAEEPKDAQVWRAPGNVTIERRPPQLAASAIPQGVSPQRHIPPGQTFVPAAPAMVQRPVRRMPNVEEFPVPAQNALKARHGEAPSVGLAAQKKKVGFLERLSNVARGRKDEEDAAADQARAGIRRAKAGEGAVQVADGAPKGLKIERPRWRTGYGGAAEAGRCRAEDCVHGNP